MLIRPIPPDEVQPLRQTLLYPQKAASACEYPGDANARTRHFGAFLNDQLVGVASLFNEAPAEEGGTPGEEGGAAWRIRGVAVREAHRGKGYGTALIKVALHYVAAQGGRRVWCYARRPARAFYERLGFRQRPGKIQKPWTDLQLYLMERPVRPAG